MTVTSVIALRMTALKEVSVTSEGAGRKKLHGLRKVTPPQLGVCFGAVAS